MQIERADFASRAESDDERIPITLSSETPVERWFGREILDHAPESVDLSRANRGLPLLANHDTDRQIGRIEDVSIGADRKIRGFMRFSRRPEAQAMRDDVIDGIVVDASIGYQIRELTLEKDSETEGPTYRATRWTLLEGSLVPVPADPTVGVDRSAEDVTGYGSPSPVTVRGLGDAADDEVEGEREAATCGDCGATLNEDGTCPNGPHDTNEEDPERAAGGPTHTRSTESRPISNAPTGRTVTVSTITAPAGGDNPTTELVALAREFKALDLLPKWIEQGASKEQALRELAQRRPEPAPITPADAPLSDKEQRDYSIVRALNAIVDGRRDGFEFEVSDQIAKRLGKSPSERSLFIPMSIQGQRPDLAPDTRTQLSVGAAGKGAEAKFTEYGGFIELLRNRLVTAQMGAQYLSGLQGDLAFTTQSGAGSFTWGAETANAALSSLSTALKTMSPKVGQSATTVTRQLLRQAVFDVENMVRNDIAKVHALGIDLAAIHGTGASNQPRGVTNVVGIGSVVGGTNGAQPSYDNVVDLQKELAIDNALDGSLGYVVNPLIAARLMKTQQFASTNGVPIWTGSILDGMVAGFKAMSSQQVVTGQTKGTSTDCSPIIFGDWSSLIIGEWGAMEIIVDPYSSGPAIIKLASIQMIDVLARYPEKFATMADARI